MATSIKSVSYKLSKEETRNKWSHSKYPPCLDESNRIWCNWIYFIYLILCLGFTVLNTYFNTDDPFYNVFSKLSLVGPDALTTESPLGFSGSAVFYPSFGAETRTQDETISTTGTNCAEIDEHAIEYLMLSVAKTTTDLTSSQVWADASFCIVSSLEPYLQKNRITLDRVFPWLINLRGFNTEVLQLATCNFLNDLSPSTPYSQAVLDTQLKQFLWKSGQFYKLSAVV